MGHYRRQNGQWAYSYAKRNWPWSNRSQSAGSEPSSSSCAPKPGPSGERLHCGQQQGRNATDENREGPAASGCCGWANDAGQKAGFVGIIASAGSRVANQVIAAGQSHLSHERNHVTRGDFLLSGTVSPRSNAVPSEPVSLFPGISHSILPRTPDNEASRTLQSLLEQQRLTGAAENAVPAPSSAATATGSLDPTAHPLTDEATEAADAAASDLTLREQQLHGTTASAASSLSTTAAEADDLPPDAPPTAAALSASAPPQEDESAPLAVEEPQRPINKSGAAAAAASSSGSINPSGPFSLFKSSMDELLVTSFDEEAASSSSASFDPLRASASSGHGIVGGEWRGGEGRGGAPLLQMPLRPVEPSGALLSPFETSLASPFNTAAPTSLLPSSTQAATEAPLRPWSPGTQGLSTAQKAAVSPMCDPLAVQQQQKKKQKQQQLQQEEEEAEEEASLTWPPPSITNLMTRTASGDLSRLAFVTHGELAVRQRLGSGSFGVVFLAKHRNEVGFTAAKVILGLRPDDPHRTSSRWRSFEREWEACRRLRHRNVVRFDRVFWYTPSPESLYPALKPGTQNLCIEMEYCSLGSLDRLMRAAREHHATSQQQSTEHRRPPSSAPSASLHRKHAAKFAERPDARLSLARQVAAALDYMHSEGLAHRDIRGSNVVLDIGAIDTPEGAFVHGLVAKVCDFGACRSFDAASRECNSAASDDDVISLKYQAPEVLRHNSFGPKSDVFSFGVLMWEIATLEEAWKGSTDAYVMRNAAHGARLEWPSQQETGFFCHEDLRALVERCWDPDPEARPTMKEVLADLHRMSTAEAKHLTASRRGATSPSASSPPMKAADAAVQ